MDNTRRNRVGVMDSVTQQIIADPFQASIPSAAGSLPGFADSGLSGATSQLEIRNARGMTFEASGGTIAATFPDGESLVISS